MLSHRFATVDDCRLLGEINHRLIADEGHRNPMTAAQLADRMQGWLQHDNFQAVLFEDEFGFAAYALYRDALGAIHLRHFFVARGRRRQGIGRVAMTMLLEEIWPADRTINVDVLCHNRSAIQFWRALGFSDYALMLERPARDGTKPR